MTDLDLSVFDPLRSARHKDARAARECADWEAALELQELAPGTRYNYRLTVWDLLETFPLKAVDEFTTGDIEQLIVRYPAKGRSTRLQHLKSFFRYLYRKRLIQENPMDFLEPIKKRGRKLPDVFSDAEIEALCSLPSPDGELFCLMFETGMRRSECCRLKWKHINLNRGELIVLRGKGSKDRLIPLTVRARQALANLALLEGLEPDDHLWYVRTGGHKSRIRRRYLTDDGPSHTAFARWYRAGIDAAEVRYRNPHVTRHTFATRWRRGITLPDGSVKRLDLDDLQIVMGHASIQTTSDLYSHTNVEDVARRMAEIQAAVGL